MLTAFARDVDVIRGVAGDMTRLGAMAAGHKSESYAGLGVQMSGPGAVVARWSVGPADARGAARLTALGDRGRHARSAVGMASLPLNAAVEVEAIFELR